MPTSYVSSYSKRGGRSKTVHLSKRKRKGEGLQTLSFFACLTRDCQRPHVDPRNHQRQDILHSIHEVKLHFLTNVIG